MKNEILSFKDKITNNKNIENLKNLNSFNNINKDQRKNKKEFKTNNIKLEKLKNTSYSLGNKNFKVIMKELDNLKNFIEDNYKKYHIITNKIKNIQKNNSFLKPNYHYNNQSFYLINDYYNFLNLNFILKNRKLDKILSQNKKIILCINKNKLNNLMKINYKNYNEYLLDLKNNIDNLNIKKNKLFKENNNLKININNLKIKNKKLIDKFLNIKNKENLYNNFKLDFENFKQ